jgi:pimeloyl-ACP methyl ester carboxylesterase
MMPIYEMPLKESSVEGLVKYIERFVDFKNLSDLTLLGNSLGGHIALIYALNNPENVRRMVLTGSSGLFEDSMGGSFPKRGNYEYIKERVIYTFYDPNSATKELIDEVFDITNNNQKCLRIINIARSAQRHNLAKDLPKIEVPTLLIWGLNDTITPPEVAHEFQRLLPNAELKFIDKCCHAAMMEHPDKFNVYLESFLEKTTAEHVS